MPATINNDLGKITINEDIIASIASYAAAENYGIVGMNAKTTGEHFLQFVGVDSQKRGVKVTIVDEGVVDIDVFVTIIYGTSLSAVAENTISNVRYSVHECTGLTVRNVNIHVDGVRV